MGQNNLNAYAGYYYFLMGLLFRIENRRHHDISEIYQKAVSQQSGTPYAGGKGRARGR
jgi:hypothetical protein